MNFLIFRDFYRFFLTFLNFYEFNSIYFELNSFIFLNISPAKATYFPFSMNINNIYKSVIRL